MTQLNPEFEKKLNNEAQKIKWKITLSKVANDKHIATKIKQLQRIDKWTTDEFYDIILDLFVDYEKNAKNWTVPLELEQRIEKTGNSIKKRKRSKYISAIAGLARELTIYLYELQPTAQKKYTVLDEVERILCLFKFRLGRLGHEIFEEYDLIYLKDLKSSIKFTQRTNSPPHKNATSDKGMNLNPDSDKKSELKKNGDEDTTFESLFYNKDFIQILNEYLASDEGGRLINTKGEWISVRYKLMGYVDALIFLSIIKHNSWVETGTLFSSYYKKSIDLSAWRRNKDGQNYSRTEWKKTFIDDLRVLKTDFEKKMDKTP
ncbi:MAG: hypothetical protein V2I62_09085 [Bacteroidales bacterium]|jgi:hypothetical protein|nr:hypothetical protein [Bacteroidales bacterium]